MKTRFSVLVAVASAVFLQWSSAAKASELSVTFTGTVSEIGATDQIGYFGPIQPGVTPFTLNALFDTSLPNVLSDDGGVASFLGGPAGGIFDPVTKLPIFSVSPGLQFTLTIGSSSVTFTTPGFAQIGWDANGLSIDMTDGASFEHEVNLGYTDFSATPHFPGLGVVNYPVNGPQDFALGFFVASAPYPDTRVDQIFLLADSLTFIETTPIPAALPLFASGLGILGFLAHRRKRKALAA